MNQKFAIIFVVILIASVLAGLWFLTRSNGAATQVIPGNKPAVNANPASNEIPARALSQSDQARKAQLETIIAKAIPEKQKLITKSTLGRPYTPDELSFVDNPRLNIINDLLKKGKLSPADKQLLTK